MAGAIVDAVNHRGAGRIDVPLTPALRPSTGPPRVSR
jgi:hypothetical protein